VTQNGGTPPVLSDGPFGRAVSPACRSASYSRISSASELRRWNDLLTQTGFRRSQTIAYRPARELPRLRIGTRVVVEDFKPSASQRRVLRDNSDLIGSIAPAKPIGRTISRVFAPHLDERTPTAAWPTGRCSIIP